MMFAEIAGVRRRLSTAVMGTLVLAGAIASVARGSSYGELRRFGGRGVGAGELEATEEASAFGVDPTDNSVYVADLPDETNKFRIQKFSAGEKGEYRPIASVEFKPKDAEGPTNPDTVEGIAVDPALKRVYVLVTELRPATRRLDPEREAASQLYAFSTEQSGEELLPATGTSKGGVLDETATLKPLSGVPGDSLLEPDGIAVDPTTHEVIILGEEEAEEGEPLVALQRIGDEGTIGARYVDRTNYLENEATSPVVSSTGKVYVERYDEIAEIPSSFTESRAPRPLVQFATGLERLTEFPGEPPSETGGALAIGAEGTIYTKAGIERQVAVGNTGFSYPGVIAFTSAGVEEGWTGGQSSVSDEEEGPCQISFQSILLIAAGKDHDVFVYVDDPVAPKVIEFGPSGTGCPTAAATIPTATVNGAPVAESEPIPLDDDVTLTSDVTQANATSVEWEFGDGTTATVTSDQYQTSEVTHQFTKSGAFEVSEKIHTDDLATPEISVHSKVDIAG